MVFCDGGGRIQEDHAGHHGGCCSHPGRRTPNPDGNHPAPSFQPCYDPFPNLGRDRFLCVLQQLPDLYVEFVFFHLFPFIISCSLMRARCNLEREVASVQRSSLAISLWE